MQILPSKKKRLKNFATPDSGNGKTDSTNLWLKGRREKHKLSFWEKAIIQRTKDEFYLEIGKVGGLERLVQFLHQINNRSGKRSPQLILLANK